MEPQQVHQFLLVEAELVFIGGTTERLSGLHPLHSLLSLLIFAHTGQLTAGLQLLALLFKLIIYWFWHAVQLIIAYTG